MVGIYEEAGVEFPEHEVRAFWQRAFSDHRHAVGELKTREFFPHLAAATGTLPAVSPRGPIEAKGYDTPAAIQEAQEAIRRREILREVVGVMVEKGQREARRRLEELGYSPSDITQWMKRARNHLHDTQLFPDIEEARAISAARYEAIFEKAWDALDMKNAISAQKQLDRVLGVVQEEGGGIGDLAELARMITQDDPRVRKVIDVEYEVCEGHQE